MRIGVPDRDTLKTKFMDDRENHPLRRARRIVENTSQHLFLTGKAGTGKTTFLRKFVQKTHKRFVVLAPTGIAAVNAGGATVHSFFQFPFAPYVPGTRYSDEGFKQGRQKVRLIRSLDLVIIDEISMVRADLLDHIDAALRRIRASSQPFGGVQLLMIGDLQQLAPVVRDEEWELLRPYYDTPFFFGSRALREAGFVTVELQHVFRQTDDRFLDLLNHVRDNRVDDRVLAALNRRYVPGFDPADEDGYIRLVTHNVQAQDINRRKLEALPGPSFRFEAEVEGNFPASSYPTDALLELREGAQVMFVKNDAEHRWYNGSLGRIVRIGRNGFAVRLTDGNETVDVQPVEWTNQKYALNAQTREIEARTDGVFRQYPVRTAWAITIHKSQGLTFDRAVIDAHAAFSHGQTYVALSRCRTLEGLVLSTPVPPAAIINDAEVVRFSEDAVKRSPDDHQIECFERQYVLQLLDELFSFVDVRRAFDAFLRLLEEYFYKIYPRTLEDFRVRRRLFGQKVEQVGLRFHAQYERLLRAAGGRVEKEELQERLKKGAAYFRGELLDVFELLGRTSLPTDNADLKKRTDILLDDFGETIASCLRLLGHVTREGFDCDEYARLRALEKAGEGTEKSKNRKTEKTKGKKNREKIVVPQEILHPELFGQLVEWRKREAANRGVPVYIVLPQRALMGIANLQPVTPEALELIPYMGKSRTQRYADELLAIVRGFSAD